MTEEIMQLLLRYIEAAVATGQTYQLQDLKSQLLGLAKAQEDDGR